MRADTHDGPEQMLHIRGLIHCCSSHVRRSWSFCLATHGPGHTLWHKTEMPTGSHDVSSWRRQTGRGEGRSSLPLLDRRAQATKKAPAPAGEGWSRRLLGDLSCFMPGWSGTL